MRSPVAASTGTILGLTGVEGRSIYLSRASRVLLEGLCCNKNDAGLRVWETADLCLNADDGASNDADT